MDQKTDVNGRGFPLKKLQAAKFTIFPLKRDDREVRTAGAFP